MPRQKKEILFWMNVNIKFLTYWSFLGFNPLIKSISRYFTSVLSCIWFYTNTCMHACDFMIRIDAQKRVAAAAATASTCFDSILSWPIETVPSVMRTCTKLCLGFASYSSTDSSFSGWSKYASDKFERDVSPYAEASRRLFVSSFV